MGCARAKMILSAVTTVWLIVCAPRLASSDIAVHCAEVPTQVYLGELPNAMFLHPRGLGDRTRPSRSYQRPLSQHHDATGPIWSVHTLHWQAVNCSAVQLFSWEWGLSRVEFSGWFSTEEFSGWSI